MPTFRWRLPLVSVSRISASGYERAHCPLVQPAHRHRRTQAGRGGPAEERELPPRGPTAEPHGGWRYDAATDTVESSLEIGADTTSARRGLVKPRSGSNGFTRTTCPRSGRFERSCGKAAYQAAYRIVRPDGGIRSACHGASGRQRCGRARGIRRRGDGHDRALQATKELERASEPARVAGENVTCGTSRDGE